MRTNCVSGHLRGRGVYTLHPRPHPSVHTRCPPSVPSLSTPTSVHTPCPHTPPVHTPPVHTSPVHTPLSTHHPLSTPHPPVHTPPSTHPLSHTHPLLQGLSIPFACVGSGDPVRVLRLYTTNTLDVFLKHLLLRHMYNLPLPILLCNAQALRSETSYCYCYSDICPATDLRD